MQKAKTHDALAIGGMVLAGLSASALMLYGCMHPQAAHLPSDALKAYLTDDYTDYLLDDSGVHQIDIEISDLSWDYMISHAEDEQYVTCTAVIDGERFENIAIRPKGNSSLTSIASQNSEHFSFKIEFDRNDPTLTYHGLDKLSLGNLGQDPSCLKDHVAYRLFEELDVPAPLSSYTVVSVNGEPLGLYLASEAIEDAFCQRNYGDGYGQLYKPDSFAMNTIDQSAILDHSSPDAPLSVVERIMSGEYYADATSGDRADILGDLVTPMFASVKPQTDLSALLYAGDNVKDYSVIFDTNVFPTTDADEQRLVSAIRTLNTSDDPASAVDADALTGYFAAHNFVDNYDSYNSVFVHNFYLHEQDGKVSLVPWDYNLAFGSFNYECAASSVLEGCAFDYMPDTGNAMTVEQSMVNYPIDSPTFHVELSDRPLLQVLLTDETLRREYHAKLDRLLQFVESGEFDAFLSRAEEQIRPYVEQGLTFYTPEEFEAGASAMETFCRLRAESIRGQLNGDIPATLEGQQAAPERLTDASELHLSDLANFNALIAGLDTETVQTLLETALQEHISDGTKGAVLAVREYAANPSKLTKQFPALVRIPFVWNTISGKVEPYILLVVSMIVMLIGFSRVRRYRRR
ncbi:MAG: CotH kinase family protein [Oscillospiraceae bacterium]|nr:CotH kinase family protein [Oscillospiraceae bacterium]